MNLDFKKGNGLLPAVIQDSVTGAVLMVGYMNDEALAQTRESGRVTFYSRSRERLWTKGETSGNFLLVKEIVSDCDNDAILVTAKPSGPTCHTGERSCFGANTAKEFSFLAELEETIESRKDSAAETSYTAKLFKNGVPFIAQKVGEEATEVVIASLGADKERIIDEAADLLYHLMVLLSATGCSVSEVIERLKWRRGRDSNPRTPYEVASFQD